MKALIAMLPLLQCPRTGTSLSVADGKLVSETGEEYPIINGKPILVRQVQDFHVTPPSAAFISKNTMEYEPPRSVPSDAICLHLGSGDVPSTDPRVISMDILPTANTDIVAEAEYLPFKTQSIDYIESGAVFEHVFSPLGAAAEVRRVLKDGGEMFIDTAFLQGYHGFPSHYFNMTPQAVETFICDDFVLEDSYVPPGAMPTHALVTQIDRFLELLPREEREALEGSTLRAAVEQIRQSRIRSSGLAGLISEYGHRSLAASFAIRARKPKMYDVRRSAQTSSPADRAAYYAARVGVIQRHHEIELYRRLTSEQGKAAPTCPIPSLSGILNTLKVMEPLEPGAFVEATKRLREWDRNLTAIRDETITAYLTT